MVAILYCFLNGEVSPSQTLGAREQSLVAPGSKSPDVESREGSNLAMPQTSSSVMAPRTLLKMLISETTPDLLTLNLLLRKSPGIRVIRERRM